MNSAWLCVGESLFSVPDYISSCLKPSFEIFTQQSLMETTRTWQSPLLPQLCGSSLSDSTVRRQHKTRWCNDSAECLGASYKVSTHPHSYLSFTPVSFSDHFHKARCIRFPFITPFPYIFLVFFSLSLSRFFKSMPYLHVEILNKSLSTD